MLKNNKTSTFQKNNNNNENTMNQQLLNLFKYRLYPPPIGSFEQNVKISPHLNLMTLEPVLSKGKRIVLGDGSFSKVFLYQNKISKIKYAVKQMNIELLISKTNSKNIIIEEINIQGKILHPNIIRLFNYFKDKNNENIFLILEYASKGTLFDYIQSKRGLDESEAFYYFFQAVNAVFFLHKNQIIHRDIKPENLLINQNNILKLCDFGWSVCLNNDKRVTFCGTVEYMAPEIVKNERYDFSIDVWSLGVLLYELIHSYSPFVVKDLNINKIENNILSKELRFKKGVSLECRDLIEKLLIKDAENRIKVGEIYKHPFILKYINIINRNLKVLNYINYTNNGYYKNASSSNFKGRNGNNNSKKRLIGEISESLNEFGSIPAEPEASKILFNFDEIVRQFNKIDINANKNNEQKESKDIQNNIMNTKEIIKIDKNTAKKTKHKKSITLNNSDFIKIGINSLRADTNNDNQNEIQLSERINKKKSSSMKEKFFKILIKKINYENPDLMRKKFIKKSLIKEYNSNLNKKKNLIINYINKNNEPKKNGNFSFSNILIKSYINNAHKYNINKKIKENLSDKNINYKSKLNNVKKSFVKVFQNGSYINKTHFYNGNFESYKTNQYCKNIPKTARKINIKKILIKKSKNSLNKLKNSVIPFNSIKKARSKDNIKNKFTVNLSNINVYNLYSSNLCPNNYRFDHSNYINHANTFVFMDKGQGLNLDESRNIKKIINNTGTDVLGKNKIIKIFLSKYKNKSGDNSNKKKIPNLKKNQTNNKIFLSSPKLTEVKDKNKEKVLSVKIQGEN